MTNPNGGSFTLPPTTITAVLLGGVLVSLFDGVPYRRVINQIYVECSTNSPIEIFRGIISEASKIGGHPVGDKNTYMPPNKDEIPPGFPVYVRWPLAISGTATARAVFMGFR